MVRASAAPVSSFIRRRERSWHRISYGEHLIAYNMIGAYVIEWAKEDASIGIVFPADYITLMSRIAFIPVTSRHPESAKPFLDYLPSERGQKFLGARSVGPVSLGSRRGWRNTWQTAVRP